jgi:hypothetical protein
VVNLATPRAKIHPKRVVSVSKLKPTKPTIFICGVPHNIDPKNRGWQDAACLDASVGLSVAILPD